MAQPKFTFPILNVKDYAVDKLAEALLGSEFPGVVPLAVQGDGNCLFHAASLLALGNEGHHAQLRSMVVSDLRESAAVCMYVCTCMYSMYVCICTNVCMHIITQCWNVRPDVHDVRQISKW